MGVGEPTSPRMTPPLRDCFAALAVTEGAVVLSLRLWVVREQVGATTRVAPTKASEGRCCYFGQSQRRLAGFRLSLRRATMAGLPTSRLALHLARSPSMG